MTRIIVATVLMTTIGVAAGASAVVLKHEGMATLLGVCAFFLNAVVLTTLEGRLK